MKNEMVTHEYIIRTPGFTAKSSLFLASTYYRLSSKKYRGNARPVNLQTMEVSSSKKWKIPHPLTEPPESGRRAWMDLEKACYNLYCEECRKDCLSFINGLHDAINIKLGKPMATPNDFIYLRDFINDMSRSAFT
jgi:hypothetical protein